MTRDDRILAVVEKINDMLLEERDRCAEDKVRGHGMSISVGFQEALTELRQWIEEGD